MQHFLNQSFRLPVYSPTADAVSPTGYSRISILPFIWINFFTLRWLLSYKVYVVPITSRQSSSTQGDETTCRRNDLQHIQSSTTMQRKDYFIELICMKGILQQPGALTRSPLQPKVLTTLPGMQFFLDTSTCNFSIHRQIIYAPIAGKHYKQSFWKVRRELLVTNTVQSQRPFCFM